MVQPAPLTAAEPAPEQVVSPPLDETKLDAVAPSTNGSVAGPAAAADLASRLSAYRPSRQLLARIPAGLVQHRGPLIAAGFVVAAGLGFVGARSLHTGADTDLRWSEAVTALRQGQDEVARLAGEVRTSRQQIEALRSDRQRTDTSTKLVQVNERLEKTAAENATRISRLSDQIDRLEKTQRDPSRVAALVERLDRIEKQTQTVAERVTTPVPPPKPATISAAPAPASDVTQTGSIPAPKAVDAKVAEPDPRKTQLDGYVLRDIGSGVALIEARNGRLLEVRPGQTLATGNRVEAIERRGRQWVVVTQKGFIADRVQ